MPKTDVKRGRGIASRFFFCIREVFGVWGVHHRINGSRMSKYGALS